MKRAALCTLVVLGLLSLYVSPVVAQGKPDPNEQFQDGVKLAKQRDYQEAINLWLGLLDSADVDFQPKVRKAIALAYKKLERYPEAWHYLTLYLRNAPKEDRKAGAWLEEVEKELAGMHRKVSISCEPDGATLGLDPAAGAIAYPCPLTWWFVPGKHEVSATKEGHHPQTAEIDVLERDDEGAHEIKLVAIAKDPPVVAKLPEKTPPSDTITIDKPADSEPIPNLLEWSLVGAGGAAIIAGGIFHSLGYSKNEDLHDKYKDEENYPDQDAAKKPYDDEYADEVQPKLTSAYVLYGLGTAAVTTGVVLLVLNEGEASAGERGAWTLAPMALPQGGGALATFEF